MNEADWHTYQILTKRPRRMLEFEHAYGRIPEHIWLGTSVELADYKTRIDILREIDATVRFVSFEPLLGPMGQLQLNGIGWAIVGGESGPNCRPTCSEWVREIRDQCLGQGVRFFFKQWGGPSPKSGGRVLDGKIWDEYPDHPLARSVPAL